MTTDPAWQPDRIAALRKLHEQYGVPATYEILDALEADVRRLTTERDIARRRAAETGATLIAARDALEKRATTLQNTYAERDQFERERDAARAALREIRGLPNGSTAHGRAIARRALGEDT